MPVVPAEPAEPFQPGDRVTVISGPFTGEQCTVEAWLPEKRLVRVVVTVFGRAAPIEVAPGDLRLRGDA